MERRTESRSRRFGGRSSSTQILPPPILISAAVWRLRGRLAKRLSMGKKPSGSVPWIPTWRCSSVVSLAHYAAGRYAETATATEAARPAGFSGRATYAMREPGTGRPGR
jgi:hypothetical protein